MPTLEELEALATAPDAPVAEPAAGPVPDAMVPLAQPDLTSMSPADLEALATAPDAPAEAAAPSPAPMPEPAAPALPPGAVELVDPQGQRVVATPATMGRYLGQGYKPADEVAAAQEQARLEAEYGGVGGGLMALAKGTSHGALLGQDDVVSGALTSLGLGDNVKLTPKALAAIAKHDPEKAAQLKADQDRSAFEQGVAAAKKYREGLAAVHQGLYTGGEVLGTLAPALVGGSTALAATPAGLVEAAGAKVGAKVLGNAATAGLGRKALAGLTTGAVEGGLGQLSLSAGEHATDIIHDPTRAAQDIALETAGGTLVGGVFGGIFGAGAHGLGKLGSKADELGEALDAPKLADVVADQPVTPENASEIVAQLEAKAPITNSAEMAANDNRGFVERTGDALKASQDYDNVISQEARTFSSKLDEFRDSQDYLREHAHISEKRAANVAEAKNLKDAGSGQYEDLGEGRGVSKVVRDADGKRVHAPVSRELTQREVNVRSVLDQTEQAIEGFATGLSDADAKGASAVLKHLRQTREAVLDKLRNGEIGEAYHQLDQGVKGGLGRFQESASPQLKETLRNLYEPLQAHLEDADITSGWGKLGEWQQRINPHFSSEVKASQDAALSGTWTKGGEVSIGSKFDNRFRSDPGQQEGFLRGLGDTTTARKEEAMRRYLRTSARSAVERAKTWGGKEAQAHAEKLVKLARDLESQMDAAAVRRLDKVAADQLLTLGSTAQMIQGAVGIISPRAANLMQTGAAARTGIARAAMEAGSAVTARVTKAAAQLARGAQTGFEVAQKHGGKAAMGLGVGAGAASALISDRKREAAIKESNELMDPQSPRTRALFEESAAIERAGQPELARAQVEHAIQRGAFISSKLPASTSPAPFANRPKLDAQSERKLTRYIAASYYPKEMFDRLGSGHATMEDVETAKTLYKSAYGDFVAEVAGRLDKMKVPPSRAAQQRLHMATGLAVRPSMEPQNLQKAQAAATAASSGEDLGQTDGSGGKGGSGKTPFKMSRDPNAVYASRADRVMTGQ